MSLKTIIEYPVGAQVAHCTVEVPLSAICEVGKHDQNQARIAKFVSGLTSAVTQPRSEDVDESRVTKRARQEDAGMERPTKRVRQDDACSEGQAESEESEDSTHPAASNGHATINTAQSDNNIDYALRDGEHEIYFRTGRGTTVMKALKRYAERMGRPLGDFKLMYEGKMISEADTPKLVSFPRI